jgi:hypothetical protein
MWTEGTRNQDTVMKPLIVIAATLTVLVVIWISYDLLRTRTCEELLEQSTPTLKTSLAFLDAKGEIALGRTQVKALSEGAEKLNAQFKACCVSRQKNFISSSEYGNCLRRAQAYEGKVRDVKQNVEQAQAAKASRDPNRESQYAERAQEVARIAIGTVGVAQPTPPAVTVPPRVWPRTDAAIGGGPRNAPEPDAGDHVTRDAGARVPSGEFDASLD